MKNESGYKYLLCYKLSVPIYDLTVEFCNRYISGYSRTHDQMVQAARSGMQNIIEGSKLQGLKGYIKLAGVSRGSFEELLNDFVSYARQNNLKILDREESVRQIREVGQIWEIIKNNKILPVNPNFPNLPDSPLLAVNLMITLINQANYLIDKLIISLKDKHMREGGLTEELYWKRKEFRGF